MTPPSLPVPLRSKQGCWTCRLRKKKCDETRPLCSTCSSLSITCYAYGPKPAWMDDPEQERRVVAGFKDIVRHTSRHRPGKPTATTKTKTTSIRRAGRLDASETNGHANGRRPIAPQGTKPTSSLDDGGASLLQQHVPSQPTSQPSYEDAYEEIPIPIPLPLPAGSSSNPSSPPDPSVHIPIPRPISMPPAEDSTLLMHFLDHVFPLQYPLYRPDTTEGGRGWLLSMLLRTTPFYHAALATSLHHHRRRRVVMASGMGKGKGPSNGEGNVNSTASARAKAKANANALVVEQERHLQVAIALVTERASNACPAVGLDIMVTVVQLVFFEIFAGDSNSNSNSNSNGWASHLRATMSMFDRGISHDMKPFQLTEESRTILKENLTLGAEHESPARAPSPSPLVAEEVTSFRFLTATIVWLDIISCITKGTAPFLLSHHSRVLDRNSQVELEGIMGCRNRVMLLIGRVADLAGQWLQPAEGQTFECGPLREVAYDIDGEIQCELAQLAMGEARLSETGVDADNNSGTVPVSLVTRLFASMASIYLHLVTQGLSSSSLKNLDASISSQAMTILRTKTPSHLLPALVCALFIIGLVASTEDDEQYFRDVFSTPLLCESVYQDRARILPILEEVWNQRRVVPRFDWKDFLDVAGGVLLL